MANIGSSLFQTLRDDELFSIVKKHFPKSKIKAFSLCHGGLFNTTYRVDLVDEASFILRLGPICRELLMGYEHDMMTAEAEVLRRMKRAEIPCSEVLAVDTDHDIVDRDYMLVRYIDSIPFSAAELSDEERFHIDRECGRLLRRMHAIPCEAFGRATDVLTGGGHRDFFESIFSEILDLMFRSARDGFFSADECERVIAAVRRHEVTLKTCKKPVLCHGDMWSGNVLVKVKDNAASLAAIIDVDRAYFGDVDFDLGNPWILTDAFLEGYGVSRASLEVRERKIKRTVAALVYFLIEAYVWHAQYNGKKNAQNGKKAAFERIEYLETV